MVLCYSRHFLEAILGVIWDAFVDPNWDINWDSNWDANWDDNCDPIGMLISIQNSTNL